jgi:hypothetical protein
VNNILISQNKTVPTGKVRIESEDQVKYLFVSDVNVVQDYLKEKDVKYTLDNVPEDISKEIDKKFDTMENATCRTCKHRQRYQLNPYSTKVIQCCDMQPSRRSNSGYKTIKVTDKACFSYEDSI